ncbi:type II toxin-antitoxin system HipA family toxin [Hydrogenophaga sp.]|uniref:type II toxin-antitoxin system HipA family toxin n=1 Tax=Hydrogenophaga sp. TaxID=1904254 RepID=UPI002731B1C5|nr:type II toxin-antitoxin system HipA family toxin [Hydrogenophaga sp.]MDP2015768.1 type II toxin-antitoxin system HipA family toxin [Hydrogenophaga sp.]MDP3167446.1 type II toxin-antitoxin system HipA family toxin [Hydrogenophaga sp.]MDP3809576.1 type II toxin-antitoxin system HipA family toxin [Hydrogenophaga sp.]
MKQLVVWMNGEKVATWEAGRTHKLTYEDSWARSSKARSLSLSLPLGAQVIQGDRVRNYFDNLLPDNERIRERLKRRYQTESTEVADLLEAIGRDCVGAVQLLPPGMKPKGWDRIEAEPLQANQVASIIDGVTAEGPAQQEDEDQLFRISIAGAQEKTALLLWKGQWCRPLGATPTSHIVKLPLGLIGGSRRVAAKDSVDNEWLCSKILSALGLPVARTDIASFGHHRVLMVERFDREWMDQGQWMARLPQEDLCQALGLSPAMKYETDKGPGLDKCLEVLRASSNPMDGSYFLLAQLAFWLLAATDGHAKNFSIFLNREDAIELTPIYDVLSMWPYFGSAPSQFNRRKAGLAMGVKSKSKHYLFHTIIARHWHGLAKNNGGTALWERMQALVQSVPAALDRVESALPADFPQRTWGRISVGMREHANTFTAGLVDVTG